jgi:hypothetical protein
LIDRALSFDKGAIIVIIMTENRKGTANFR